MTEVLLHELTTSRLEHRTFADRTVETLREVVNHPAFLEAVRSSKYSSTWRSIDSGRRERATPDAIAELIATGHERGSVADSVIDLRVVVEPLSSGSLGVVYPPSPVIHTNISFYEEWMNVPDPLSLAAHWMHEWMHVVGFYHPFFQKRRDVAYRVGDLVSVIGRDIAAKALHPPPNYLELGLGYLQASTITSCSVSEDQADVVEMRHTFGATAIEAQASAPIIDVHTHTFNASDLSVAGFLADVLVDSDEKFPQRLIDPVVRFLARLIGRAPGAVEELRRLDKRAGLAGARLLSIADEEEAREQEQDDAEFRERLESEIGRLGQSPDAGEQELYERIIAESGAPLTAFAVPAEASRAVAFSLLRGFGLIGRYVSWVKRLRRYRHDIIQELVNTYGENTGRVDLFVSAQVDYGKWLNDEPKTPFEEQVRVGERLIRAFPGRLHFLAAFDPRREADHPGLPEGSLYTVQRAVEDRGFIGVKMYPPMGFSAIDNESHEEFQGIPQENSAAFGRRLDEALEALYSWAEREDVPLMAHCNNSNYPKHDYGLRASPYYWEKVIERYPNLRLNLGHFGGQKNLGVAGGWPAMIISLMANSRYVYADVGMFHIHGEREREAWIDLLVTEMEREPTLAERLLYGSDWFMLAKEKGASQYLLNFERELRRRLPASQVEAILGGNAVRFLGLSGDTRASRRLKAFYRARGLAIPPWLSLS
jgi:predicted TIM-barrel fold metal-dependent hydrolase